MPEDGQRARAPRGSNGDPERPTWPCLRQSCDPVVRRSRRSADVFDNSRDFFPQQNSWLPARQLESLAVIESKAIITAPGFLDFDFRVGDAHEFFEGNQIFPASTRVKSLSKDFALV